MYQVILLIHIFIALGIIGLVLVQQGKGATMGAAFGSGASQTVFGSRGSGSFLFRITIGFLAVFFITSIALNYIVVQQYKAQQNFQMPIAPQPLKAPGSKNAATEQQNNNSNVTTPALPEMPVRQ